MYKFIYPAKDAYVTDEHKLLEDHNFGADNNLVLKKDILGKSDVNGVSRILMYFNLNEVSKSLVSGDIPSDVKYSLRLYERKTSELAPKYSLGAYMLYDSQSVFWNEGTGVSDTNPNKKDGVTWQKTSQDYGDKWFIPGLDSIDNLAMENISTPLKWGHPYLDTGGQFDSRSIGGGVWWDEGASVGHNGFTSSLATVCNQDFSYESPDMKMDVTNMINMWLDNTRVNHGMIVKWVGRWSGSQEDAPYKSGNIEFYSRNSDSIYSPKIELKWDDKTYDYAGSNFLSLDKSQDIQLYMLNLRKTYKEKETPKFRVAGRQRFQTKSVSRTKSSRNILVIPHNRGWYSITDVLTGEVIVPFGDYSKLSSDSKSSYFKLNLTGYINNRTYRIKFKIQMDDKKSQIFDKGFDFRVVN